MASNKKRVGYIQSKKELSAIKVRRNQLCLCGSLKKFKFCCLNKKNISH